jgi:hypothetical protein
MICEKCLEKLHDECKHPKTCPCQHRTTKLMPDGTLTPTSQWGGALTDRDAFVKARDEL